MLTFLHKVELLKQINKFTAISFLQIQLQLHKFDSIIFYKQQL